MKVSNLVGCLENVDDCDRKSISSLKKMQRDNQINLFQRDIL